MTLKILEKGLNLKLKKIVGTLHHIGEKSVNETSIIVWLSFCMPTSLPFHVKSICSDSISIT